MEKPLELTFRDVRKTPDIEELIESKIAKLEQVHDKIISAQLAVERPQEHQKTGNPYRVRLTLRVPPGHEIISSHEPGQGNMHDGLDVVLRSVFDSGLRQLKKLGDRQRGDVKRHEVRDSTGIITELAREADHGFLRSHDGRSVYFHRNSVVNHDFDKLDIGAAVRYEAEMGDEGLQASTVHVLDPRGVSGDL